jgi:hypothetical protein
MRTIETQVFTFAELSDSAKEYARNEYRKHNLDYDWWDCVYDDAKTIGALFGLDINRIYFSGFWSQGDGAAFNASYSYKSGGLKAVMQYAPQDSKLHGIVARLQDVQRKAFYRLHASCEQTRGNNIRVNVDNDSRDPTDDEEDIISSELNDFAHWIYSRLESEYEYLQSDQVIDESMVANEYEFTANGELI